MLASALRQGSATLLPKRLVGLRLLNTEPSSIVEFAKIVVATTTHLSKEHAETSNRLSKEHSEALATFSRDIRSLEDKLKLEIKQGHAEIVRNLSAVTHELTAWRTAVAVTLAVGGAAVAVAKFYEGSAATQPNSDGDL
jgi:anti-sigma-K factor RskA